MKISKRLQHIASFIDDGSYLIDVGCDHALLDIYLVQNKKNIKAIASDINPNPLQMAQKNIISHHLENAIMLKLGYGLETMPDTVDTIVIAGMGGLTIVDILTKGLNQLTNIQNIIVSPHNDWCLVRTFIVNLGYQVAAETIIYEKQKPYLVIKFTKGQAKYTAEELEFGPILLKNKDVNFYHYYRDIYDQKRALLTKIPNNQTRQVLIEELNRLEKILKI